jgi:hypothetical protein
VNGLPFCFAKQIGTLDCLDPEISELVRFPHDPQRVMMIRRYCFFKERIPDPAIFLVPETTTEVFATQSITKMIENAKMNGFIFVDAEQVRN